MCIGGEEKREATPRDPLFIIIRKDCLDWFLSYAADEHLHQGIVDTAVAEDGAPEGNCPEVPGLRVEWCFSTKVWLATFVSGPNAGKKTSLGPQDLTVADWAKMQAIGTPDAIEELSSADQRQRKAVAKALCLVRLSDQSAVAEAYETPKKMRRQGDREAERFFENRTQAVCFAVGRLRAVGRRPETIRKTSSHQQYFINKQ